jgi:dinuclear metal center YbgI/SA1388 family protein
MEFKQILAQLEALAPERYAMPNDNTGFQLGNLTKDIKRVCLATDASEDVIEQAIAGNADLLLTHHPLIMSPILKFTDQDFDGRRILKLASHQVNHLAMHTNYDVIGMAELAANLLEIKEQVVFYPTYTDEKDQQLEGVGRYGSLPRQMTLKECAEHVKANFALASVLVYGDSEKVITTAAISPGSSGRILPYALNAKVDLLITGDIKHPMAIEATANGLALIDAGHFGTEKIFVPDLRNFFQREMPELEVFTAKEENPFYVV